MVEKQTDYSSRITDALEQLSSSTGHRGSKIFRDWVDCLKDELAGDTETQRHIVDTYADLTHHGEEEIISRFVEANQILLKGILETDRDILGTVHEEYGGTADQHGQYYTPTHVCDLVNQVMGAGEESSADDEFDRNDISTYDWVADPCCGSGRFLMHDCRRRREHAAKPAIYVGVDIDETAAKIAAINLALGGVHGFIIQGDSLRLDAVRVYEINIREGPPLTIAAPEEATIHPEKLMAGFDPKAGTETQQAPPPAE